MKKIPYALAVELANKLFPHTEEQTRYSGGLIAPFIRHMAKQQMAVIVQKIEDISEEYYTPPGAGER